MKISIPDIDTPESKQKELIDNDYTNPVVSEEPWEMKVTIQLIYAYCFELIM